MYKKRDVLNLRYSDYKLTSVDEKIYNELGFVLHQVDKLHEQHDPGSRVFMVIYKEHFGSVLGQRELIITHDGKLSCGTWFLDRNDNKDFMYSSLSEKERALLEEKYNELISGYWKDTYEAQQYAEFLETWAKKAWELDILFNGDLSGGIEPPKNMRSCTVTGKNSVSIKYDLPETCGYSDVRYHVVEPHKIRTDEFLFTESGQIQMNGNLFPSEFHKTDPWISEAASAFLKDYAAAFRNINAWLFKGAWHC